MKYSIRALALTTTLALSAAGFSVSAQTDAQQQSVNQRQQVQHTVRDQNRDGICDVCSQAVGSGQQNSQGKKAKQGRHWGPGDGSGNQGVGPRDGTGYGAQSGRQTGSGNGAGQQGAGRGQRGGRR